MAGEFNVQYATADGSATAGSDYTAATNTLTWADGNTDPMTYTVPITVDVLAEGNETVNLTLTPVNGSVVGSPATAVLTITDNDASPVGALVFGVATFTAGENGGQVTITVNRVGGSAGAVSVGYATANGSATAGSDYTATAGTLSWADGDTDPMTFTIAVADDALAEGSETVNLTLSAPTGGAALGSPATAVLTVTDNDTLPPPPVGRLQFGSPTFTAAKNGGLVTITVNLALTDPTGGGHPRDAGGRPTDHHRQRHPAAPAAGGAERDSGVRGRGGPRDERGAILQPGRVAPVRRQPVLLDPGRGPDRRRRLQRRWGGRSRRWHRAGQPDPGAGPGREDAGPDLLDQPV
jgi:hypothetical protein